MDSKFAACLKKLYGPSRPSWKMKFRKILSDYFQSIERKYIDSEEISLHCLMNRNNTQSFKKRVRNQSDSMKIMQQKYSEQIYITENKQHALRKFVSKLLASSEDNQCYYITPRSVFRTQSNINNGAFSWKYSTFDYFCKIFIAPVQLSSKYASDACFAKVRHFLRP